MNIINKNKTIEERLADIEKWQEKNDMKLKEDLIELKTDYMDAPGTYAPNVNLELIPENQSEIYTTEDYRLDMGGDKFKHEILSEDYIDELIGDSLKVSQMPEKVKLIDNELATELKSMAGLIRSCERFIKNNPDVIVAFKDGLMALRRQYAEAVSHLRQAQKLPISDFLTNEAILRYNLNKFKKSIEELNEMAFGFSYDFKEITSDFIEWE